MSTAARLAAFAVAVVAVFGAAFGVGRAVGPIGGDDPDPVPGHGISTDGDPVDGGHGAGSDGPHGGTGGDHGAGS